MSDEELARLLSDPICSAWRNDALVLQLKKRLQYSYPVFLETLDKLSDTLKALAIKIGPDDQGHPTWVDEKTQKRCLKRFTLCLRRKEHEVMIREIEGYNNTLDHLTTDNLELEPQRRRRRAQKDSFRQIRDHAARLHGALRSCWSCACTTSHCAELQLEKRDWDKPPCFCVTFPLITSASHLTPATWHETQIKALDGSMTSTETNFAKPVESNNRFIPESTSNLSTLSFLRHPQGRVFKSTLRTPSPQLKGIEKKSVAWAIKPSMEMASLPYIAVEASPTQRSADESRSIDDLCSKLRSTLQQPVKSVLGKLKHDQNHYEVFSVSCEDSADPAVITFRDVLAKQNERVSPTGLDHPSVARSVAGPGVRLTRKARLQLAVTLASSALQLYTTPWLNTRLRCQDIRFRQGSIDRPYISYAFARPEAPPDHPTKLDWSPIRNHSIFALGVLLLELAICQPLDTIRSPDKSVDTEDFLNAIRLCETLQEEEGQGYLRATQACLRCEFGSKVKVLDLENAAFRQAIYEDVVQPLEQELKCFCQGP